MTGPVNNSGGISSISSDMNVGSNMSVQYLFAQLQLELAKANKDAALNKIDAIKESQKESARMTTAINNLRSLKSDWSDDAIQTVGNLDVEHYDKEVEKCKAFIEEAKAERAQAQAGQDEIKNFFFSGKKEVDDAKANFNESGEYESTMMSVEMENYFKANGIDYASSGVSRRQNAGEWDRAIKNLETRAQMLEVVDVCKDYGIKLPSGDVSKEDIDTLIASIEAAQENVGSDIQQEMVFVQDFMGQYNAYTQGASSAISQAADTLKNVARG